MAKVITFSRVFPAYHPKKGQPTYFVEKFWNSFNKEALDQTFLADYSDEINFKLNKNLHFVDICNFFASLNQHQRENIGAKHHTIRGGNRFKVGDYFSPRVWSGKPYNSKQIVIAPDIEVKKVWDFEIWSDGSILINSEIHSQLIVKIAENDGLSVGDLLKWFKHPKPFKGQIICWNENVEY